MAAGACELINLGDTVGEGLREICEFDRRFRHGDTASGGWVVGWGAGTAQVYKGWCRAPPAAGLASIDTERLATPKEHHPWDVCHPYFFFFFFSGNQRTWVFWLNTEFFVVRRDDRCGKRRIVKVDGCLCAKSQRLVWFIDYKANLKNIK